VLSWSGVLPPPLLFAAPHETTVFDAGRHHSAPEKKSSPGPFHLFEDTYPELPDEKVDEAMREMDQGYLEQEYYRRANYMIPLPEGREETFTYDDYCWTEHISRKLGLWGGDPGELLKALAECGFKLEARE